MGTRSSTLIQLDGEVKVCQYGQGDGYPSGLGMPILELIRSADMEKLKSRLRTLRPLRGEEGRDDDPEWKAYFHESEKYMARFVMLSNSLKPDSDNKEWHAFLSEPKAHQNLPGFRWSRDCRGDNILEMLMNDSLTFTTVQTNVVFPGDSLYCEWAYVIDFDKNTFEVYQGFNKEPLPPDARFKFLEKEDSEYKPVKIVAEWPLDNLPTDEEFHNKLNKYESDDEDEE